MIHRPEDSFVLPGSPDFVVSARARASYLWGRRIAMANEDFLMVLAFLVGVLGGLAAMRAPWWAALTLLGLGLVLWWQRRRPSHPANEPHPYGADEGLS